MELSSFTITIIIILSIILIVWLIYGKSPKEYKVTQQELDDICIIPPFPFLNTQLKSPKLITDPQPNECINEYIDEEICTVTTSKEYFEGVKLETYETDFYKNFQPLEINYYVQGMRSSGKQSKGEKLCRQILEHHYGKPFPTVRPDFLKNPETGQNLELDGYNEELAIAFEYNGSQHTNFPSVFFKDYNDYKKYVEHDLMKRNICQQLGIYLITIREDEIPYHKIPEEIEYLLPENVYDRQLKGIPDRYEVTDNYDESAGEYSNITRLGGGLI